MNKLLLLLKEKPPIEATKIIRLNIGGCVFHVRINDPEVVEIYFPNTDIVKQYQIDNGEWSDATE